MFVAEGVKLVHELLQNSFVPVHIFSSDVLFLGEVQAAAELVSETELRKMSGLKNPNKVVAAFKIPERQSAQVTDWVLAIDKVRDPGNLGTIIRLCDWFGIRSLVCAGGTADCYNPKTVQASMGSIARVAVGYTRLEDFLSSAEVPIFGAFMSGNSVYKADLPAKGILVMGNEGHGISKEVAALVTHKINIPSFGEKTAESLNVATATGILLSEIRRR